MSETVLHTKLFVPPLRPLLVHRPRYIERLNQGLRHGCKLTLISAPAGFGKSTLVSEWVGELRQEAANGRETANRVAWLSLDENDNDPARFLTYFITALARAEGIGDGAVAAALAMLQSPQPTSDEAVLTPLINEISTAADRIILVLDDYHRIEAQPIHDALTFLLEHLPPQMHLAIVTREDPQLPLSRLRARGQLSELRAADLRLTLEEAADFLNRVMGLELSAEDIAELEARTEGWVAGLQLAAISMQGRQGTSDFIKSFSGSHRYVLDYLLEEVLGQQPERVQTFLLKTAILDRLSGSLCDALTGQENGQQTLEYLEQTNLFIVRLDDERRWYRYHHLFGDLLNHRLRQVFPDQIAALHLRASGWCQEQELPAESIRHAMVGEDFEQAAGVAELAWPAMSGSYQSIQWLGWVKRLPDDVVCVRPVLSLDYAWAYLNAGNLEAAEAKLGDVERWLPAAVETDSLSEAPSSEMVVVDEAQFGALPVSLALARAYHAQAAGNLAGTVRYARRVLDLLPEGDTSWRSDITALLGLAHWARGELAAADQTFSDGLLGMKSLDVVVGTFVLADIKTELGQLQAAVNACEYALRLAAEYGMPLGTEDVYSAIGHLHRERGDLEAAAQALRKAKKLGDKVELPDWQYRWCIAQGRLWESQGDLDGALELLEEGDRAYVRTPLPDVRPVEAMKARVWVKQGRLNKALSWAQERGVTAADELSYLREFEHVTLARVLMAQQKRDPANGSVDEVMGFLERLLHAAEAGGRIRMVIEILGLQALAQAAEGEILPALIPLERALKLAEPEGYLGVFVDEGPPMAQLLNKAFSRGILPDCVQRVLAAFPANGRPAEKGPKSRMPKSSLVEPLSDREIEVLQLVAGGLTNSEIASRLYLSLNTVKAHTRNIYGKLDAHNRTQAVAKARALNILPD